MIPTTLLLLVALLPAAVSHPVDEPVSPKPGVLIVAGGGVLPAALHPRARELEQRKLIYFLRDSILTRGKRTRLPVRPLGGYPNLWYVL